MVLNVLLPLYFKSYAMSGPEKNHVSWSMEPYCFLGYRLGQISNNVPRKSPVGIFEEKGANHFF